MVSLHSDSSSPSLVVAVQTPHVNGHFFFPFSVSHLPLAFLASHFSLLMVSLHSDSSSPSLVVAVQTPHVNGHFFFPFSVSHLPLAFFGFTFFFTDGVFTFRFLFILPCCCSTNSTCQWTFFLSFFCFTPPFGFLGFTFFFADGVFTFR